MNSTSGLCSEKDLIGLYGLAADQEVKKHFLFHMYTLFRFLVRNILERRLGCFKEINRRDEGKTVLSGPRCFRVNSLLVLLTFIVG